ncbi:MAG: biotin--[acetyl-CoA-carboxylase] ligase [Pseudomonadota bacterium]
MILDEVDSTNAEAARRAAAGETGPLWILARRQTAGRGRGARAWDVPAGNLAASYLFRPDCSPAEAALYSFTAGLAVAGLAAGLGASWQGGALKWPNDVLLNGRKLSGVLLESGGGRECVGWIVIGVGVNLAILPDAASLRPGAVAPTSITAEGGREVPPEEALTHLALNLERFLDIHAREGFGAIRAHWLAQAARLGQVIEARLAGRTVTGVFEDVDATGALVLRTPTGREEITAADVFFPG